jgi:hypothetical protein
MRRISDQLEKDNALAKVIEKVEDNLLRMKVTLLIVPVGEIGYSGADVARYIGGQSISCIH